MGHEEGEDHITIERDDRRSQLKTFRDCVVSEQHGVGRKWWL